MPGLWNSCHSYSRGLELFVSWGCSCDCEGLGFADSSCTVSGIEIIRGILSNAESSPSPISRKKSSAGCFRFGDLCVSEVVGIVRDSAAGDWIPISRILGVQKFKGDSESSPYR